MRMIEFLLIGNGQRVMLNPQEISSVSEIDSGSVVTMKNRDDFEVSMDMPTVLKRLEQATSQGKN